MFSFHVIPIIPVAPKTEWEERLRETVRRQHIMLETSQCQRAIHQKESAALRTKIQHAESRKLELQAQIEKKMEALRVRL